VGARFRPCLVSAWRSGSHGTGARRLDLRGTQTSYHRASAALNAKGIGRNDRVALACLTVERWRTDAGRIRIRHERPAATCADRGGRQRLVRPHGRASTRRSRWSKSTSVGDPLQDCSRCAGGGPGPHKGHSVNRARENPLMVRIVQRRGSLVAASRVRTSGARCGRRVGVHTDDIERPRRRYTDQRERELCSRPVTCGSTSAMSHEVPNAAAPQPKSASALGPTSVCW